VRPYSRFPGIAPKERQRLVQGGTPWTSLRCVIVVHFLAVSLW
jgi:hypothetical protein